MAATHDLGLARIALQAAVGVVEVAWATTVADAQASYDALLGRGQVAAAERLRTPFVEYKVEQARISGNLRTALALDDYDRKIAAKRHATGSGGLTGDWSKLFNGAIGGLQLAGGVWEVKLTGLDFLYQAI